jgi:hypothetical protein
MTFSGSGVLSGQGVIQNVGEITTQYTISFILTDPGMPATMSGDAPVVSNKSEGQTFTIPDQGNIVRTETIYQSPPGGGQMQETPVNILLHGWTDGNRLYLAGETYTMPSSNVSFQAIWKTRYVPEVTSVDPYTVSIGDRITLTGTALGSVVQIQFENFVDSDPSTIIINSETQISVIVPEGAVSGSIRVYSDADGFNFYYDAYEIL